MVKLKRKTDGEVLDCTVILDGRDLMAIYWDGHSWTSEGIDNFIPATIGIDY